MLKIYKIIKINYVLLDLIYERPNKGKFGINIQASLNWILTLTKFEQKFY